MQDGRETVAKLTMGSTTFLNMRLDPGAAGAMPSGQPEQPEKPAEKPAEPEEKPKDPGENPLGPPPPGSRF